MPLSVKTFDVDLDSHAAWYDATVVRTTADTHAGAGALSWTANAAFSGVNLSNYPGFTGVTAGEVLDCSVWTKGSSGSYDTSVTWSILFRNEAGTQQGTTTTITVTVGAVWAQSTVTQITVPTGATRADWTFETNTSGVGSVILIDDVALVAASSGTTYQLTASGSGASAGSASVTANLRLAASGSGTTGGSTALSLQGALSASGASLSGGSAALISTLGLSASGVSLSGGSAALTIPQTFQLTATGSGVTSGTAMVTIVTPIFRFSPPAHEEPMRTRVRPFDRHRLTYAASVVRVGGALTSVRHPHQDLLRAAGAEGVDWFLGGREYTVTQAVAIELTTMGYPVT